MPKMPRGGWHRLTWWRVARITRSGAATGAVPGWGLSMAVRGIVLLALLLGGLFAPPATASPVPTAEATFVTAASQPLSVQAAKKKPRASLTAAAVVLASGKVRVSVTSNAKKVKLAYRTAKDKKRTAILKIRKGQGTKTLAKGAKITYAQAKATSKLRVSVKVRVSAGAGAGVSGALLRFDVRQDGSPVWVDGDKRYHFVAAGDAVWSPDGTRIAFVGCWTGSQCQVFARTVATGEVAMISTTASGAPAVYEFGMDATTSLLSWLPDGQGVVLASNAINLADGPKPVANGMYVYLKNLATGAVTRILEPTEGGPWLAWEQVGPNRHSTKVVFAEMAKEGVAQRYSVRDVVSGVATFLTGGVPASNPTSGMSSGFAMSRSGARLAVKESTSEGGVIRVFDVPGGSTLATFPATGYALGFSPDESQLLYGSSATVAGSLHSTMDFYIRSIATGEQTAVLTHASSGNEFVFDPVWSPGGGAIAFTMLTEGVGSLVPGDTNGKADVFVKDLASGLVARVSVDTSGKQGNCDSSDPSWSPDGKQVAFGSCSTSWNVSVDDHGYRHMFVKTVA
jgi:Tol biopolymer transport system component